MSLIATHPHRILVVDENAVDRLILEKMIRDLNYPVETARDGLQAVAKHNTAPFDIIFMDMSMTSMPGIEAIQLLMAACEPESLPIVIAMTNQVTDELNETCKQAGATDILKKTASETKIYELLKQHLADN